MRLHGAGILAAALAATSIVQRSAAVTAVAPKKADRCEFIHGVASGDPLPTALILWTRATPLRNEQRLGFMVAWSVWEEEAVGGAPIAEGNAQALPGRDFTIKVDVRHGLQPHTKYKYQFACGTVKSPVGRFHLPAARGKQMDSLKYAIFSCANYRWGYFTAYGSASREPLDFWVHVGDFIYEHSDEFPSVDQAVRKDIDPPREVVTLEDYRRRYAFYRRDNNLQNISAAAPLIAIWDDHEVANDAWQHGAQNHQPSVEGNFSARRQAALQAYHEWLPTRWNIAAAEPAAPAWKRWREFSFGNLATLLLLETRLGARTTQAELTGGMLRAKIADMLTHAGDQPDLQNCSKLGQQLQALHTEVEAHRAAEGKQMLGPEQLQWVGQQARAAAADALPWLLVAQPQVMQDHMSADYSQAALLATAGEEARTWTASLRAASSGETQQDDFRVALAAGQYRINLDLDGWMGYPAERSRLLSALAVARLSSVVTIYGGDSHNAWAGKLRLEGRNATTVAVEFDGMSVSSPGIEHYRPQIPPDFEAAAWRAANPTQMWANTNRRGYMLVSLNKVSQQVRYMTVDTKSDANTHAECLAAFQVSRGDADSMRQIACT